MQNYWNNTIDFQEYLSIAKERLENPTTQDDIDKKPYYELGLQRMDRTVKRFKPTEEHLDIVKNKDTKTKILIISEAWCGDASATVPVLSQFFNEHGIETRIFLRDNDHSLIDQFQTNGTQSIPKVIILNEDFSVKNTWGPRTAFGTTLLKKFKANPEKYPRENFYNDLQIYYAKNRGKDAINEILELI